MKLWRRWTNRGKHARGAEWSPPLPTGPPPEEALATLDPRVREVLLSMYREEPQLGIDGQRHALRARTNISPTEGMWLHDLCLSVRPAATIEIGMAYGFSTLYFLAALAKCGSGHHTAIDPFQVGLWQGIGLAQVRAAFAGMPDAFTWIEDRSDRVATDLARDHRSFDVIFIDGSHLFDDAIVDFNLYAPLCTVGGHIVLDDVWMSSIRTVAEFVRANRQDFVEVVTAETNISVFRKVAADARPWRHFREFAVRGNMD